METQLESLNSPVYRHIVCRTPFLLYQTIGGLLDVPQASVGKAGHHSIGIR